ncbi:MAG: hypothetical protein QM796_13530 [Chthoniobacteraceae bacterium]
MPITISVEGDLTVVRVTGLFDSGALYEHGRSRPKLNPAREVQRVLVLIDETARVNCSFAAIWDHSELRARQMQGIESRTAIVATTDLAYGMSRIFETVNRREGALVRVFRSEAEARQWLLETPETMKNVRLMTPVITLLAS